MIEFWLAKNFADLLYGLIFLGVFFGVCIIVGIVDYVLSRHRKKKFDKKLKEAKKKNEGRFSH